MNRGKGIKAEHKPNTSPTKQHYIGVEELWELFKAYKEEVKSSPLKVQDYVGKDGQMVYRDREKPITFEGFDLYCIEHKGCAVNHYFHSKREGYQPYEEVCRRIKAAIKDDQIVGGMCNIYNPSITARLNGLTEKVEESGSKEVTIKVKYDRKGSNTEPTA